MGARHGMCSSSSASGQSSKRMEAEFSLENSLLCGGHW